MTSNKTIKKKMAKEKKPLTKERFFFLVNNKVGATFE
jgi:hypothetical protein